MNLATRLLAVITLAFLTGCASVSKMPLNEKATAIDTSQKSILVGKLSIRNDNKPSHQPNLLAVFVNQNEKDFSFTQPTLIADLDKGGKEYFISMAVEPGKATLKLARFMRQVPLLLNAMADLPFEYEIDVPENQVVYIGNINAIIKPRQDEEPRAGLVIPLIDQAVAGFSNGTFEVSITDNYAEDMEALKEKYPHIADHSLAKNLLPVWKHPELRETAPTILAEKNEE
ncbi:hypothetical protein JF535_01350 [Microbulbifer salipaludis]|uniref:Lipoprotein n=1 Tax=Microbulbifer salipaludis TaxID=187980 RepID=A0ABS3E2G3_9GAMM|nr:hypothetical protein [Microbulbifer salipaludis]MBN8429485.1 hypothetical protein [Microbulbifer salipaludis]